MVNEGSGTVGEYNATTGAAINAKFITGLNGPSGVAFTVKGSTLFAAQVFAGAVSEFDANSGALVFNNFVTG